MAERLMRRRVPRWANGSLIIRVHLIGPPSRNDVISEIVPLANLL